MKALCVVLIISLGTGLWSTQSMGQDLRNFVSVPTAHLPLKKNVEMLHTSNIDATLLKRFKRDYSLALNENWLKVRDGYRVKFTRQQKAHEVFYDVKGDWCYSIKTYSGHLTDAALRSVAEDSYEGYKILQVIEIETIESAGMPTYIIQMEGLDYYIELRVNNGNVEPWKQLSKQIAAKKN